MNDTVALGDVVIAGTEVAILETDDGDGWLSNDDRVLHTVSGRLARGILGDLPNTEIEIRRVKDFRALATKMSDAGYGKLSPFTALTGELRHAVASFQTDHHLPSTGLPDAATMSALDGFLSHLGASETKAAADSAR